MGPSDQVLTLPAIRYLRSLENIDLEIIVGEYGLIRDLFPVLLGSDPKIALLKDFWNMNSKQKQKHSYDWVLDLDYRNPKGTRSAPEWLIPRRQYLTFQREERRTRQKTYGLRDESGSQYWQRCFEMAFQLGSVISGSNYSREKILSVRDLFRISKLLPATSSVEIQINRLLSNVKLGPLLIVSPGGYPVEKRWPAERFTEVICRFLEQGMNVVVLSLRRDSDSVWKIFESIRSRPLNWRRRTSGNLTFLNGRVRPAILPYLFQRANLHLSNENALAQIAGAVDIPQILI
jgi:ADP-heptose:LPS heptosyltransferase